MRVITLLITAIVANAALAGCFAKKGKEPGSTGDTPNCSVEASTGPNATAILNVGFDNDGCGAETVPTASFVVKIGGNETAAVNGSIPAKAGENITFDGSASKGHELKFAWDFGDGETAGAIPAMSGNGTGILTAVLPRLPLPQGASNGPNATDSSEYQVVQHAYVKNGTLTVTMYVTDADNRTATATAMMDVKPAGPPSGTWLRDDAKSSAGTACAAITDSIPSPATKTAPEVEWVLVSQEANGTSSVVSKITVTATGGATANTKITLKGPGGTVVADGKATGTVIPGPFAAGTYKLSGSHTCPSTPSASAENWGVTATAAYVAP